MIRFTKMHAIGNDFIVIDLREYPVADLPGFSKRFCHRRFGIGADQVILLDSSKTADFRMGIYNADGSEVEMCGNGIRALAKYIWERGMSRKDVLEIETLAGIIRPARAGDMIRVDMGAPILDGRRIPVNLDGRVIDHPLQVEGQWLDMTCVSMGNPHAVFFVDDVASFPVTTVGPTIETHALFPKRTNVEFVQTISRTELRMRVWERGAGETMACGTGACATGVAAMLKGLVESKVTVHLLGGDLIIEWDGQAGSVFMTGPATEVFEGTIND